jgi:hypothetical protein
LQIKVEEGVRRKRKFEALSFDGALKMRAEN